jgi:hypothetical protein
MAGSFLLHAVFGVAVAAVNRTIATGTERNLRRDATLSTDSFVHFTLGTIGTTGALFTSSTTGRATTGFVLKTFFCIELLFRRGENEFSAALAASQGFVFVHLGILLRAFLPGTALGLLECLRRTNPTSLDLFS